MLCLVDYTTVNVRLAKMPLQTQVEEKQLPNETLVKMMSNCCLLVFFAMQTNSLEERTFHLFPLKAQYLKAHCVLSLCLRYTSVGLFKSRASWISTITPLVNRLSELLKF